MVIGKKSSVIWLKNKLLQTYLSSYSISYFFWRGEGGAKSACSERVKGKLQEVHYSRTFLKILTGALAYHLACSLGVNRFSDGFFPSTSRRWNSLLSSVFQASFNLPSFKRQAYHHLRDQMAIFFLHIYITIPLFRYFGRCIFFFPHMTLTSASFS